MMRLIAILIIAAVSASGCTSEYEREIKEAKSFLNETTQQDWGDGIPFDDLVSAAQFCKNHGDLQECGTVQYQLTDISISLSSCQADQRSTLCQAVVRVISKHPIASLLPKASALKLPDSPWYWNLPTTALEAHSSNLGYRIEAAFWWRDKWRAYILSCVALLIMAIAWILWSEWNDARQQRANELTSRREALIEQKKSLRILDEQAHIKVERQTELERETAITEQQHLVAKQLAEQQAAEAKLATEQAEAVSLLNAAFAPPKPKRRKRVPSSK